MLRRLIFTTALLVTLPVAASAGSFNYYGPHLGFTQGPDQFLIGGQLQWNGVAPHLAFVPGVDLGLGNDLTVVSVNADFHYQIATNTAWQPYVGGGMGLHFVSDNVAGTSNDSVAGGHFIVGGAVPTQGGGRFFTELKLGFGDSPDLKAVAGWNLRSH